jgi:glutamate synthase (NADPH/NADH) large chain
MSKMGVSTVASYVGSQLFEPVGLSDDVLARYFPGFHSRLGGATSNASRATYLPGTPAPSTPEVGQLVEITNRGEYQWRRDGELHLFNPRTVQKLQHATRQKRYDLFKEYSTLVDDQSSAKMTLRSLLSLVPSGTPIPLDEVEGTRRSSSA